MDFAYILRGYVEVGSKEEGHKEFRTLVFSAELDQNGVSQEALVDAAELILVCPHPHLTSSVIELQISVEPLYQTAYQHNPFVTTTRDEIEKTIVDYLMGRSGFENPSTRPEHS